MRSNFRPSLLVLGALLFLATRGFPARGEATDLKAQVTSELGRYYEIPFKISVREPGVVTVEGEVHSYVSRIKLNKRFGTF